MNLDPVLPSMVAAGFEEYPEISSLVDSVKGVNPNVVTIEATKLAIEAGKAVAANAVMIGAVAAMKGFPISKDILLEALREQVPEKFLDLNIKAFEMGYDHISGQRNHIRGAIPGLLF
jgi:indolepyruvate ferredoxin oxidoreductase beta subunit